MVSGRSVMPANPRARKYRGLYCGLRRGIQELQKWADALGPGGFVVPGAFDALVMEIFAELPAILQEHVAKFLDIVNHARAFVRTDVEPDARARLDGSGGGEAMNDALIPPHGWRKSCQPAEALRIFQAQIKRQQAAQRRAAHASDPRIGERAVFLLNERHDFLPEKFRVAVGAAATEARRFGGRVFVDTHFSDVVNSDDDKRLHCAAENEIV